ncbi:hypothetical protein GCM10022419_059760 [Nonomuraea rosea]|uniref:Uncharacterized protein n=2 Tax=Nonomuraea rosea TaxID=638574 RepID=A0ABP6XQA5_9ACTN
MGHAGTRATIINQHSIQERQREPSPVQESTASWCNENFTHHAVITALQVYSLNLVARLAHPRAS